MKLSFGYSEKSIFAVPDDLAHGIVKDLRY